MFLFFKKHLIELKWRFFYICSSILFIFIICYIFKNEFLFLCVKPLILNISFETSLVYTHLTEMFLVYINISLFFTILYSIPYILYQCWIFTLPALYFEESLELKEILKYFLFFLYFGLFLGYCFFIPFFWDFLIRYNTNSIQYFAKISEYIHFITSLLFYNGFFCLLPLILIILNKLKIQVIFIIFNQRLYFYLLFMLFISVISPPEFLTQIILFLLFFLFFELSILFVFLQTKYKNKLLILEE